MYFSIIDYNGKLTQVNDKIIEEPRGIGIIKQNLNLLEKINPYLGNRIIIDIPLLYTVIFLSRCIVP